MAAPEHSFADVLQAYEAAHHAYERLAEHAPSPPEYAAEEVMTLASIERYKADQARHAAHLEAEQTLRAATAALDAWFPVPVLAAFDRGSALVAPAAEGVLVLIRHNDAYLLERGATQEEALLKIERFLNQF